MKAHQSLGAGLVLASIFAPSMAVAENEAITIAPAAPTSANVIALALRSQTHTDCDFAELLSSQVSGNRIDLVVFLPLINSVVACNETPTPFQALTSVGPLPAGIYQMHWSYTGWQAESYPTYEQTLVVAPAPAGNIIPSALPTLSNGWLGVLAGLLCLGAWRTHRRSASR